ncbi:MAG TPA: SIMPL domain-containing protein [Candidatus Paceibacterota bacterium]|nr:SIMPL domain-containing protein [Candidatus Paceibacterota bacterium]
MDSVTRERATKAVLVLAIVLAAYVAILALAKLREYPYIGSQYPSGNVITVEGKGEVMAVPDLAEISFGVRSEKPTLAEAQADAATRMNAVIAYLKEQGIDEKDIKTTNYSANPRYEYGVDAVPLGAPAMDSLIYPPYPRPGRQTLVGYEVYQNVSVKVRDIGRSETILGGVGNLGVTDVSGPYFTIDDEDELKREARREAIKDARQKAGDLADDLDVRLVRVVSFSENSYPVYYGREVMLQAADSSAPPVVPDLPPGENAVTAYVTVTYEIR